MILFEMQKKKEVEIQMQKLSGKSVYKGIALGPVALLKRKGKTVKRIKSENVKEEIVRLERAVERTVLQLQQLYEKAITEVGEDRAAIFQAHQMILKDEVYRNAVDRQIRQERVNAEYAVMSVGKQFFRKYEAMDDGYMKARAADVKDVSDRLVRNLIGEEKWDLKLMEPSILVAEDLSPSDTVQMDREKILGFVTRQGSINSHTAILARMMNIPAIVGVPVDLEKIHTGMTAMVDGFHGEVIFDPSEEIRVRAAERIKEEKKDRFLLEALKGKETITSDGRRMKLCANVRSTEDIEAVLKNDADGIGLFRSEFLYLGRETFPAEEEQFAAYKQALQRMEGKKVIIRTMDLGADKQAEYFDLGKEENPAMGYRGIRICLKQPEIFKPQLRALLRAAVFGNLAIMYPLITSVEEVEQIDMLVKEVRRELEEAKIPYKIPEQGIMIETPAAVMISEELAGLVDFFSIGTNDLTQYTLAIDRQNEKLAPFFNPHHKAVLKMIQMTVENAHKKGKWVGICGELAADLSLTDTFLDLGVDELSVAPSMILKLRKRIREI